MKKLLLALAVLAGLVLSGMAQNKNEVFAKSAVTIAVEQALQDFVINRDYHSKPMQTLEFILTKSDKSTWQAISDSCVEDVINVSVTHIQDASFVEFLVDLGMPEKEINRYSRFAEAKMDKFNETLKKLSSPNAWEYDDSFSVTQYEACELILEVFDKAKESLRYERMEQINDAIEKTLQDNTEKKIKQYEQ